MTRMIAVSTTMAILATAAPALAANDSTYGVLTGLSVVWNGSAPPPAANVDVVQVEPGEGYVNGHAWTPATAITVNVPGAANANMAQGVILKADQPYYVYAFYDSVAATIAPLISDRGPTSDGIGPTTLKTQAGHAGNALFLGSFLTDPGVHVIPFVRHGEEVILNPQDTGGCAFPFWGAGAWTMTFTVAGGVTCQTVIFDSLGLDKTCLGGDGCGDNLVAPYPSSASAMLAEVRASTTGATTDFDVLPPVDVPVLGVNNYQTYFSINGSSFTNVIPLRVVPTIAQKTLNCATPPIIPAAPTVAEFKLCTVTAPSQGIGGYVMYRGYVESIGHLTYACTPKGLPCDVNAQCCNGTCAVTCN